MAEIEDRGLACGCGSGSRVTHTYRIRGGEVIDRRRECLSCRRVWFSREERLHGPRPANQVGSPGPREI